MRFITHRLGWTIRALFALVGLACAVAAQADYVFTVLDYQGVSSNGGFTAVWGINNQGEVAGSAYDGNETIAPFIYDVRKGAYTPLPAEVFKTYADGISDRGVVVGGEVLFDNAGNEFEIGFILDKGAFRRVAHPGALFSTELRAINSSGLVVGIACDDPNCFVNIVNFIYDPKTNVFTDMFPSTVDNPAIMAGINARGESVGNTYYDADVVCQGCPGANYGYVRSADGALTLFLVNGKGTRPRGISDSGLITGYVRTNCEGKAPFAGFVTTLARGAGFQSITIPCADLLGVAGAIETTPQGISNSGVVVGNWLDADGVGRGFVATPVTK